MFRRAVHASTVVLTTIALLDLITTLVFIRHGYMEANHLFHWLLGFGVPVFVGVKVVFLSVPIILLEFARGRSPRSAEQGTWVAVFLYVGFYAMNLVRM